MGKTKNTNTQKDVEMKGVCVILDESGSMGRVWADAIGGFNAWLDSVQDAAAETPTAVTVMKFDTEFRPLAIMEPLAKIRPLTQQTYTPRGNTALYDAIGATIRDSEAKAKRKELKISDWLCVILTDGEENSSRVETKETIAGLISRREADNWTFVYLAANQDAWAAAQAIGMVSAGSTASYSGSAAGTRQAYAATSSATSDWLGASASENKATRLSGGGFYGTGETATIADDDDRPKPYVPESN